MCRSVASRKWSHNRHTVVVEVGSSIVDSDKCTARGGQRERERSNCLPAVLAPFRHCCCRCSLLVSLLRPASRPSDQEDLFGHLMQSALQQASAVICRMVICAVNPNATALSILEMCPLEAGTTNVRALLLIANVSLPKIESQRVSTDNVASRGTSWLTSKPMRAGNCFQ